MELNLRKFNPMSIEKRRREGNPATICVVGKRGSGKSVISEEILYALRGIPAVICMSATEDGNGFWGHHIHDICIYNRLDIDVIGNLVERQRKLVKNLASKGIDPKKHPELGIGLILDDVAYDPKLLKNQYMKEIFFNGRHLHITTIITFQYMMSMSPEYRTNIDYFIACRENRIDNLIRLHKYFFGIFSKFDDFRKVFMECTNNYGCIVLDNTSGSNKIEDQVFWFKAQPGKKFFIGNKRLIEQWDRQKRDRDEKEKCDDIKIVSKSSIKNVKKLGSVKVDIQDDEINEDYSDFDIDQFVH